MFVSTETRVPHLFLSFFPKPKLFFISFVVWSLVAVAFWYGGGEQLGAVFGMPPLAADAPPITGISAFWSPAFIWFYLYFALVVGLFAAFWYVYSPHRWQNWSILGSALILFVTYFQVQVSVAINNWYGPFWDMIQAIIAKTKVVPAAEVYGEISVFLGIAMVAGGLEDEVKATLLRVQNEMFDVGADLSTPLQQTYEYPPLRVDQPWIDDLERDCDHYLERLEKLRSFILPGGTPGSAYLHLATTIVRRAERSAWAAIEAHGDHRLAMLGAVAGLASREGVEVIGMEAAAVSYPGFGADLAALTGYG